MLTIKQFLLLKDYDVISIGRHQYIVHGRNDLKEPQLYSVKDFYPYSGAIYICHLMKYIGNHPEMWINDLNVVSISNKNKEELEESKNQDEPVNKTVRKKKKAQSPIQTD